ncbi:MAG: DUF3572 domain-containing protein [Hyphomicrobium sp.]|nr:DUF3572 domain-containing protein [Hyphomicrobium sp.]
MLRSRSKPMTKDDAESLALQVLAFLLADPNQTSRFLSLTGLSPDDLRGVASSSELQAAMFEYILSDEGLLLSFCQEAGIDPAIMGPAHQLLTGPIDYS